jgi:FkbM family methyltransferase
MTDEIETRWLTRRDMDSRTISYAQNGEDVLVDRVFGRDHAGLYVDVGANDPVFHSVTKLLYENGWRGVNIEPTPSLHARLELDRPEDANLNVGISDAEGVLTFYEVAPPLHGWSTFVPEIAASYRELDVFPRERPIAVTTLDKVFAEHVGDRTVDVLKVDAEGFERPVLAGLDWSKWRPRVVLIEATWCDAWESILLEAGYLKAAFDGINNYYLREEDRGLLPKFAAPVNNADNYISYEVVRLVDSLDERFGPISLAVARFLRDASKRHRPLAEVVKRVMRMVRGDFRAVPREDGAWLADLPGSTRADEPQSPARRVSASPKRSTATPIRSMSER